MDTNNYKTRVFIETAELKEKIDSLQNFIITKAATVVSSHELERLNKQYSIMIQYYRILLTRIECF